MVLQIAANIAQIMTAIVAVIVSVRFWYGQYHKRVKLENYLKAEKSANPNKRTHTVLYLMATQGLTKDEILQSSFRSRNIKRLVHVNRDTNLADDLLFEYQED